MFRTPTNDTVVSIYKPVDLPVENYEDLALNLDVINLAKQQARNCQPDSRATEPDANELNFKSKINIKSLQATHRVDESISSLKNEIQALSISRAVSEAQEAANEFRRQIAAELSPRLKELEALKRDYCHAVDDVNSFKRANGLRRAANYPDSNWLTAGILLLALIVESGLNGHFFAAGVDTGLIGGIVQASIIAVLNIGFGFLLGWWLLPFKNHCKKRLASSLLFVFFVLLFLPLIFNLLVGHYREALVIDPDNAHIMAIESFINGILSISDFNSWVLFAIGLLFCALAIYKGYGCDDPYPGYGKLARRKDILEEMMSEVREESIEDLETLHHRSLKELEENYESILQHEKKLHNLSSAFDQQNRILKNYIVHLEHGLRYIIKLYRDTNASERSDEAPKYYEMPYEAKIEFHNLNIEYSDKRDEIAEGKEMISNLLPSIRAFMLESKEDYHEKIDGICQS